MTDSSSMVAPPPGFSRLTLRPAGFLEANGPFYGRREDDRIVIGLRIEPRHCNSAGHAHGGMLLTLVDVALTVGTNYNARTERFLPTVSVTCDFVSKASLGAWLEARVEVLRVAGQHVFSQLQLTSESGAIVARASGILLLRGDPDPAFGGDSLFANPNNGSASS